jgi:26S proteasome non-ATPase regulatory subunit 10
MDVIGKDEDGRTELHRTKGDCSHLISAGALVNAQDDAGWTALMIAASSGDFEKARSLLATPDIDVNLKNESDCTALTYAASRGRNDIMTLLLMRDDTDLNVQDKHARNTPLMRAIANKHILCVRKLIQAEARVDMRDSEGNTALHYASVSST